MGHFPAASPGAALFDLALDLTPVTGIDMIELLEVPVRSEGALDGNCRNTAAGRELSLGPPAPVAVCTPDGGGRRRSCLLF